MIYVLAILIPPVYFLIKRRWMAFAFTLAALICSIFLLAELFLAPLVLVLWFASAFFAVWDIQQRVLKEKTK
jgi:hypothetical protein